MRSVPPLLTAAVVLVGCAKTPPPRVLRMAYPHELVTIDPHAHGDLVTRLVMSAVYESLVRFEPGQPVKPGLADRWTTPDDLTWRIHVRDGVRFHDGASLNPEDVVGSIERARSSRTMGHQLEEIAEVRLLEDEERTIEITTIKPAPLLLTRLETVAIVPADFDPSVPIGTGPYRWQVGSVEGPVMLEKWDDYWARAPDFDEVSIQFVTVQEELADLLEDQKLDVVASVTVSYLRDHQLPPSWRVVALPKVATTYLGINVTRAPLDDPRVREAIDDAIDRQALVTEAFSPGQAIPAVSLVPPEVFGFSPDHRWHRSGLEEARRLIAEAGIRRGTRVGLDYYDRYSDVIGPLGDALAAIGLEVEPRLHTYETFYRRIEQARNELFLFSWNFRVADASPFLDEIVHSRDQLSGFGSLNGAALSHPAFDDMIEEAAHETRSEWRLALLQQLLAEVASVHAYLPLYHPDALALVRRPFEIAGQMVRPQDIRLIRVED